jgi:hypothetical protein
MVGLFITLLHLINAWNIEHRKSTHSSWVGEAATSAPVECVNASVYQLLNFTALDIFSPTYLNI